MATYKVIGSRATVIGGHRVVGVTIVDGTGPVAGSCPAGMTEGPPAWGVIAGSPALVCRGPRGLYARLDPPETRDGRSACAVGARPDGEYWKFAV